MIVLDTHVLIWWAAHELTELSSKARKAIDRELEEGSIAVSSISAWELAMLVAAGRLSLTMDVAAWLNNVAQIEALRFVPVDNEIAVASTRLPGEFHKDPADRIIVATARKIAAPLLTADRKIRDYPHVHTIW